VKLCVVGTGYVGLVAGACFADSGNEVVCVDSDLGRVAALARGEIPFFEPGLGELVRDNAARGRLQFTGEVATAVRGAQAVFIAVGTPESASGEPDLTALLWAAESVARALTQYTVVVNKSTVPVGTADRVRALIERHARVEFDVASNPEFLKEGSALEDFFKPDRVVIGSRSPRALRLLAELYAPFVRTGRPILTMDERSAELTKYAANAMLATRISFMNDMAELCERVGADVDRVRQALAADHRIGPWFLFPGPGYGGSCLPKDVTALLHAGRQAGVELEVLEAVQRTNRRQRQVLFRKAERHFGTLAGRTFAVWGLAFKPRTDDLRESPALDLVRSLLAAQARVKVHDPVAAGGARRVLEDRVEYSPSGYQALEGADAMFLVTEWNEFRNPDFLRMKELMRTPVVFDGRNLYDRDEMTRLGFLYYGVGR
jgi:UDPglucose 6-dehydrogenase